MTLDLLKEATNNIQNAELGIRLAWKLINLSELSLVMLRPFCPVMFGVAQNVILAQIIYSYWMPCRQLNAHQISVIMIRHRNCLVGLPSISRFFILLRGMSGYSNCVFTARGVRTAQLRQAQEERVGTQVLAPEARTEAVL
jgi:hypothetical protein